MKIEPKTTHSPEATERLGIELSASLTAGDVVALFGEMGSGKTTLIRGICRGLGVSQPVTSPTFTLIHEYTGRLPVYHFDLYRIDTSAELWALGFEEYLTDDGVCLIEWADKVRESLPAKSVVIYLEHGFADSHNMNRHIRVECHEAAVD